MRFAELGRRRAGREEHVEDHFVGKGREVDGEDGLDVGDGGGEDDEAHFAGSVVYMPIFLISLITLLSEG